MSLRLISRSEDLSRLHAEGYDIRIQAGYLVVRDIPYLDAEGTVQRGTLISKLDLANDQTVQPTDHTIMFAGSRPHHWKTRQPLNMVANEGHQDLGRGLVANLTFSRKPTDEGHRYRDFHHKISTYVQFIERHAKKIDPTVTSRTNRFVEADEGASVFRYLDTASTRAEIVHISQKLETEPIAIVGLGGTGSYILDLVAKTPVREIHLYDGDRFIQHNAFRAPGAAPGAKLAQIPSKVDYLAEIYGEMHTCIRPHPYFLDEATVAELVSMSFVFIAIDDGGARRLIVDALEAADVAFVDAGMGLYEADGVLGGQVRLTTSTPDDRENPRAQMPLAERNPNNEYANNIQIADLNALNAVLAVVKWKKIRGFYQDTEHEHQTLYNLGGNLLLNRGQQ